MKESWVKKCEGTHFATRDAGDPLPVTEDNTDLKEPMF